ncbi:MAG: hypothetical protein KJP23_29850 [Deltaproteobacteria bacterium]|nr:hypothetical protein [Deltaproteobacteria bacterium]
MRNDEPCDDKCGCVDCKNPLNPEEIKKLIRSATEALEKYKELKKPPTVNDLQSELNRLLIAAQKMGASAIEIESGYLYSRISNHIDENAMEVCCNVMQENMKGGDKLLKKLAKTRHSISIKYKLPR